LLGGGAKNSAAKGGQGSHAPAQAFFDTSIFKIFSGN